MFSKIRNDLENRSTSILCRDGGKSENLDGQVVIVGHYLPPPPLVGIGLTDLPKTGPPNPTVPPFLLRTSKCMHEVSNYLLLAILIILDAKAYFSRCLILHLRICVKIAN